MFSPSDVRGRRLMDGWVRADQADEVVTHPPGDSVERLDEFLATAHVSIVDVMRGAATGTRRLLLGEPDGRSVSYAVSVADRPGVTSAIAIEARLLAELSERAVPSVLDTVPHVVARVCVGDRPATVMTAVPGLRPHRPLRPVGPPEPDYLEAVGSWLKDLWRSTAGVPEPVALGREAADQLLARYLGSRQLAPVLGAVYRARRRVEGLPIRRTATHGCLCTRHVRVRDGAVIGVDDWGLANPNGEPLRDLGGFAVRIAGPLLPVVIADETDPAYVVSDFVRAGLVAAGASPDRWRDVLLLTQAERAVASLEHGHTDQIGLLATAVSALPPDSDESDVVRCE
jgi:hypothetical protein